MSSRFFAIIPAAGNSTRMGASKLLLPTSGGTIIERTLAAWRTSRVGKVVVVVRPDDQELAIVCRAQGAEVVLPPVAPPEMKDTVQYGLKHVEESFDPTDEDAWLLAPGDMPNLSPRIIQSLVAAHDSNRRIILVPTLGGKRGHPVLFPWTLAAEVFSLSAAEGLNVLRLRHESREIPCDSIEPAGDSAFSDIDTPEDYKRLQKH
ncbi:MAG: nucleotidyltransferase family protein [Pirellulaceae bacterium]|nr:nucleotidyltransferase family protein [Pirellulaceae bacterium]